VRQDVAVEHEAEKVAIKLPGGIRKLPTTQEMPIEDESVPVTPAVK